MHCIAYKSIAQVSDDRLRAPRTVALRRKSQDQRGGKSARLQRDPRRSRNPRPSVACGAVVVPPSKRARITVILHRPREPPRLRGCECNNEWQHNCSVHRGRGKQTNRRRESLLNLDCTKPRRNNVSVETLCAKGVNNATPRLSVCTSAYRRVCTHARPDDESSLSSPSSSCLEINVQKRLLLLLLCCVREQHASPP